MPPCTVAWLSLLSEFLDSLADGIQLVLQPLGLRLEILGFLLRGWRGVRAVVPRSGISRARPGTPAASPEPASPTATPSHAKATPGDRVAVAGSRVAGAVAGPTPRHRPSAHWSSSISSWHFSHLHVFIGMQEYLQNVSGVRLRHPLCDADRRPLGRESGRTPDVGRAYRPSRLRPQGQKGDRLAAEVLGSHPHPNPK